MEDAEATIIVIYGQINGKAETDSTCKELVRTETSFSIVLLKNY